MFYKTELHCHTAEVSDCARESAAATVEKYIAAGYTTVVLTNHINPYTEYFRDKDYENGMEFFIEGHREMLRHADGRINVLLGAEVCFYNHERNDYLLFGADEDFLRKHCGLMDYGLKTFHEICNENGCLLVQAHPFRPGMTIAYPEYLDGIEVNNGRNFSNNNDIANMWAERYGLIKTSGTDHHNPGDEPTNGILTEEPITDIHQLTEVLNSGNYRLLGTE